MKKVIATTLGVVLAASAVSAFAGKSDRESLAQCKADVTAYYGDDARVKLNSMKQRSGITHLRLKVIPSDSDSAVINCAIDRDGVSSLTTRDGVALTPVSDEQKVSLAQ